MLRAVLASMCLVVALGERVIAQVYDPVQWDLLALPRHFPVEGKYDDWSFVQRAFDTGRTPAVFETADGPGVVVHQTFEGLTGTVRVYIDDAADPALELNAREYVSGDWSKSRVGKPEPLAARCGEWSMVALPIPFARSCRIECTEPPRSAWITYRLAPKDTILPALDVAAIEYVLGREDLTRKGAAGGQRWLLANSPDTMRDVPYIDEQIGLQCIRVLGFGGTVPESLPATMIDLHLQVDGTELSMPATVITARTPHAANVWRNRFPVYSSEKLSGTVDLFGQPDPVVEFVWESEGAGGGWNQKNAPGRLRIVDLESAAAARQAGDRITLVGIFLQPGRGRAKCGLLAIDMHDDRGEQTLQIPMFATDGEESWCGFPGGFRTQGPWMLRVNGLTAEELKNARVVMMGW